MNNFENTIFNGLKILKCEVEKEKYTCQRCNTVREIMSFFNECDHYCCTSCIDYLYDNNVQVDTELFKCFLCDKKIYDIKYK
jgi:late competence protein required for DNA uptake (superfamily II DNA/RNA helicase)